MALQARVESLEEIPEQLRDEYEEADGGGFRLRALNGYVAEDRIEEHPTLDGLRSAIEKERENARKERERVKALQEKFAGFNVDEYEKLKQEQQEAERRKLEEKGEFDKIRSQLIEGHEQEKKLWEDKYTRLLKRIEAKTVDAEVTKAINEAGGNVTLLLPHVKSLVKMVESDDGDYVPVVTREDGAPRVKADGSALSIKDLVAEMRENDTFAAAFKGSGKSGSGTQPESGGTAQGAVNGSGQTGGTPPQGQKKFSDADWEEKKDFLSKYGRDRFKQWEAAG